MVQQKGQIAWHMDHSVRTTKGANCLAYVSLCPYNKRGKWPGICITLSVQQKGQIAWHMYHSVRTTKGANCLAYVSLCPYNKRRKLPGMYPPRACKLSQHHPNSIMKAIPNSW